MLPAVSTSLYFHAREANAPPTDTEQQEQLASDAKQIKKYPSAEAVQEKAKFSASRAVGLLWVHFRDSYSDLVVVQWSLWWALAMCGFTQV